MSETPHGGRALIVANGAVPRRAVALREIERAEFVLAADGGIARMADLYGLSPDAVLGDFDSAPGPFPDGVEVIHAPDQNATDLEKAIRCLQQRGFAEITLIGATGDRLDHTYGAIRAVCLFGARLVDDVGEAVRIVGPGLQRFETTPGQIISLMPCGQVAGLATKGLRWNLAGEPFDFPDRDGTSNVAEGDFIEVAVTKGTVVVYRHHADLGEKSYS